MNDTPQGAVRSGTAAAAINGTHVESAHAGAKQGNASSPPAGRFALIGMAVVLVGVLARQRRGFRRSGTILLR